MKIAGITVLTGLLTLGTLVARSQVKDSTEVVKIETTVVLAAPPPMEGSAENWNSYEFISGFNGKEFAASARVDSVSKSKGITELHTYQGNLFILIGQKEMKSLTEWVDGDIYKKIIMVRGMVIPYKDKFAIKIDHLKQIAVQPWD